MIRKIKQLIMLSMTILLIMVNFSCLDGILAKSLLQPKRHPITKTPQDYQMNYQNIEFKSIDGISLKGWLIPGTIDKLVIVTNPMPFSKYGFSVKSQGIFKITNLEVELLKTVKQLNNAGYNVIIFDFRNHGESASGNNGFCGVGMFEWQDVIGVMNYIETREDLNKKSIGFVSQCTGANATIIAMGKDKEKFRNVKCMIALQPVAADVFTRNILKDKFSQFASMYNGIDKKIKKYTGYYLEELTPKNYIKDIDVPVMYVQVEKDPWSTKDNIQGFYDNTRSEKKLLWLEGNERFDGYNYFGNYPEEMIKFLKKYL